MKQRLPVTLRESIQEVYEQIGTRAALLRYVRSIPPETRRSDHGTFETQLVSERAALEGLMSRVIDDWRDGTLSVAAASHTLRTAVAIVARRELPIGRGQRGASVYVASVEIGTV